MRGYTLLTQEQRYQIHAVMKAGQAVAQEQQGYWGQS